MRVPLFVSIGVAVLLAPAARAQHVTDLWVGQSAGKLAWSPAGFPPGSAYNPLLRVDTFLHGWSNNDPGFDRAQFSSGNVGPLTGTLQVMLEVIALDPGLYVLGPSLSFVLDSAGDRGLLGGSTLHTHLTWFVDETDPGFDAEQCVWEGTFRFVDTRNVLGPSAPFTLLFTNVAVRGGEFPPTDTRASGDFDGDGGAGATDLAALIECLWGPEIRPNPADAAVTACEVDCYNVFDFDDDMDVDLGDVAGLQRAWGD